MIRNSAPTVMLIWCSTHKWHTYPVNCIFLETLILRSTSEISEIYEKLYRINRLFLHDRKMIKYTIVFSKRNMQHSIKYTVSNTETGMQHTECCILHLEKSNMFLPWRKKRFFPMPLCLCCLLFSCWWPILFWHLLVSSVSSCLVSIVLYSVFLLVFPDSHWLACFLLSPQCLVVSFRLPGSWSLLETSLYHGVFPVS